MKRYRVIKERTTITDDYYVLREQGSQTLSGIVAGHDVPPVVRGSASIGRSRLRMPRLHTYMGALFLLGSTLVAAGGSAPVVELSVDSVRVGADQEAVVSIRALPPDGIAAATLTLAFDTDALEVVGWETPLFPSFVEQFAEIDDEPFFGDTIEYQGEVYERPAALRILDGVGLRMAGVRLVPAGPNENRLLDVHFRLKPGAQPGFYPLDIEPTVLTSGDAGYPATGASLDALLAWIPPTPNTPDADYPSVLTADGLTDAAPRGWLSFTLLFSDESGNQLDDAWELRYFGATGLTGPLDDWDHDGLINLLEYFHGGDPTVRSSIPQMHPVKTADDRLLIRFPIAPTVMIFEVETSTDLKSWTPLPSDTVTMTLRPDLGQTDTWTMLEVSVPIPENAFHGHFRLRIGYP